MKRLKQMPPGHLPSYFGAIIGLAVSVWANIAHATIDGKAEGGELFLAAFWPVALFVALEVLSRVDWGRGWKLWVARCGVGVVAAVAAVVSYLHLHGLIAHYEGKGAGASVSALIGPLAIDGLMAVCAAGLLTGSGHRAEVVSGPDEAVTRAAEVVTEPVIEPVTDRPTEPTQPVTSQVSDTRAAKPPVSQRALDQVMAAVRGGEPMGKSAIAKATGLSDSTTGRAVAQLVTDGLLTTIGSTHRPEYIIAKVTSEVTH